MVGSPRSPEPITSGTSAPAATGSQSATPHSQSIRSPPAASRSPCVAPPRPPPCCSAATGPPTRTSSPPRHKNTDRYAPRSTAGSIALPTATSGVHELADLPVGDGLVVAATDTWERYLWRRG